MSTVNVTLKQNVTLKYTDNVTFKKWVNLLKYPIFLGVHLLNV